MAAVATASAADPPLRLSVHRVEDSRAKFTPAELHRFRSTVWSEAVRDFARCGIEFSTTDGPGEIRRSPAQRPIFAGLEDGAINVVLTRHIPVAWDNGRGLVAVSTRYEGHPISVIALPTAHPHQVPFLSLNTCVHELLHVLFRDIFAAQEQGLRRARREFRTDWHATRLWLFHDGNAVRRAAERYVSLT
jgi:hypothetical protein